MSISINPLTYVIYVPKADLTLIQSSPTEIRELNLNWFRLQLKAWEDDEEGIVQLKTHTHNTEVSLGGLTFARVIEILDPYSITFEDGQYAVNLVGANSNVGDKVNVNQVSVRSANSAGLISSPAIEYSSFNGGVIIDVNSGISGTVFPRGTEQMPVDNVVDALLIAEYRGFNKLYLHSDITLGSESVLNDFILQGRSHVNIQVTIGADAQVSNVRIVDCDVAGILDGNTDLNMCAVRNINYLNGHIHHCGLAGIITLGGGSDAFIFDCARLDIDVIPEVNMGGSGQDLVMPNYSGALKITNLTGSNKVGIGLNSGTVILDSATVTAGNITVSGIGRVVDEVGNDIKSGIWNGGVTIQNQTVNQFTIKDTVWNANMSDYTVAGTFGGEVAVVTDIANEVWGSDPADFSNPDTFGYKFRAMLGLQQHNFRLKNQTYQQINLGNNNFKYVLTDGTIRVYNNAADAENDQNHFAEYTISATYDVNGNCTAYSVVQV